MSIVVLNTQQLVSDASSVNYGPTSSMMYRNSALCSDGLVFLGDSAYGRVVVHRQIETTIGPMLSIPYEYNYQNMWGAKFISTMSPYHFPGLRGTAITPDDRVFINDIWWGITEYAKQGQKIRDIPMPWLEPVVRDIASDPARYYGMNLDIYTDEAQSSRMAFIRARDQFARTSTLVCATIDGAPLFQYTSHIFGIQGSVRFLSDGSLLCVGTTVGTQLMGYDQHLVRFSPTGEYLGELNPPSLRGRFVRGTAIGNGRLYIASSNGTDTYIDVHVFSEFGEFIGGPYGSGIEARLINQSRPFEVAVYGQRLFVLNGYMVSIMEDNDIQTASPDALATTIDPLFGYQHVVIERGKVIYYGQRLLTGEWKMPLTRVSPDGLAAIKPGIEVISSRRVCVIYESLDGELHISESRNYGRTWS